MATYDSRNPGVAVRDCRQARQADATTATSSTATPHRIEVQHPGDFLSSHLDLMPGLFCEAVRKIRARLVAPPVSVQDYLATLTGQGLVATAAELAEFSALL